MSASDSDSSVIVVCDSNDHLGKENEPALTTGTVVGEADFKELSLDSSIFTTEEKGMEEFHATKRRQLGLKNCSIGKADFKELSLDSSIFTTEEKEEGELSSTDSESASGDEASDESEEEDEEEESEMDEGEEEDEEHVGDTDEEPVDDSDLKEDLAFWLRVSKGTEDFPDDIADAGMTSKQKIRYALKMVKSYGGSEADSDYDPEKPEDSSDGSTDASDSD